VVGYVVCSASVFCALPAAQTAGRDRPAQGKPLALLSAPFATDRAGYVVEVFSVRTVDGMGTSMANVLTYVRKQRCADETQAVQAR
jgi:hypothetical protein